MFVRTSWGPNGQIVAKMLLMETFVSTSRGSFTRFGQYDEIRHFHFHQIYVDLVSAFYQKSRHLLINWRQTMRALNDSHSAHLRDHSLHTRVPIFGLNVKHFYYNAFDLVKTASWMPPMAQILRNQLRYSAKKNFTCNPPPRPQKC